MDKDGQKRQGLDEPTLVAADLACESALAMHKSRPNAGCGYRPCPLA
jgi:hypothetical protein